MLRVYYEQKVTYLKHDNIKFWKNISLYIYICLKVSVNCGIVHIYMSYDNPHPSSVLYSDKVTATDGHPAILYFNRTVDGRPLYLTFVGTQLPPEAAGLKNCSDAEYVIGIAKENKTGKRRIFLIILLYFLRINIVNLCGWTVQFRCWNRLPPKQGRARMHQDRFRAEWEVQTLPL